MVRAEESLGIPQTSILEIGPRSAPSVDFFGKYPGAKIVFVANESFEPYRKKLPEGAELVEGGFDFILAAGLLSQGAPEEEGGLGRREGEFIKAIRKRLKPGGELILEDH